MPPRHNQQPRRQPEIERAEALIKGAVTHLNKNRSNPILNTIEAEARFHLTNHSNHLQGKDATGLARSAVAIVAGKNSNNESIRKSVALIRNTILRVVVAPKRKNHTYAVRNLGVNFRKM